MQLPAQNCPQPAVEAFIFSLSLPQLLHIINKNSCPITFLCFCVLSPFTHPISPCRYIALVVVSEVYQLHCKNGCDNGPFLSLSDKFPCLLEVDKIAQSGENA